MAPLKAILDSGHEVASVVTQPKRQKGRGLKISSQPVEEFAATYSLNILNFDDINSLEAISPLKELNAHLFVVVAFGQILSKEVLELPGLYSVNIHASLLPRYRGAAPVQRAIINGEKKSGVSIIRMNQFLDKGDILIQKELDIDDHDNALSLGKRLSALGAESLIQLFDLIESDQVKFITQDESKASYAPKLSKEEGLINWNDNALSIGNLIRGCSPWPSAYTYLDGRLLKILEADISSEAEEGLPGSVIGTTPEGISVKCGEGAILIKRLQLEGKRSLSAGEFTRGRPLIKGYLLGK